MLLNLHKKSWVDGLSLQDYNAHCNNNENTVKEMLELEEKDSTRNWLLQENVAVLREDIEKLKRLAQEFEQELIALKARVDNLESRVAFLEDHQFSTTTILSGEFVVG